MVSGSTSWCGWRTSSSRPPERSERAKVKAHMAKVFDVRDLVEATFFLGMELTHGREARTLKLTLKKLTGELVGRYGLASARARSVPLGTGDKLTKEGEALDTTVFPYTECVGSLLY